MSYWRPPSEKRESSSVIVDENKRLFMSSMAPLAPFMPAQAAGDAVGSQEMFADASNQPRFMVDGDINGESLSQQRRLLSKANILAPEMNARMQNQQQLTSNGNFLLSELNARPLSQNQLQSNGDSLLPQMNSECLNQHQLQANRKVSMPDMNVELSDQQKMRSNRTSLSPELNAIPNRWLLYNANIISRLNRTYVNGRLLQPLAPKPQSGVSPPFLRNIDSFPENDNVKRLSVNERTVSPATPALMEKSWRVRTPDLLPREIICLDDDEAESYQDVHQRKSSTAQQFIAENPADKFLSNQIVSSQTFSSYLEQLAAQTPQIPSYQQQLIAENCAEQCFSNQLESSPNSYQQEGQRITVANSSHILSSYQQGGERNVEVNSSQYQLEGERDVVVSSAENLPIQQGDIENQGIDLNKTPSQKPKRKKHRPKVIREGKTARTPKAATPKPHTPGRSEMSGIPVAKRKYVRKKKDPNLQDISQGATREIVDLESQNKSKPTANVLGEVVDPDNQSRKKPVRRNLYFDLEDPQLIDGFRQNIVETDTRGTAPEGAVTCNTTSAAQSSQHQGLIELESLRGCSAKGLKRYQVSANVSLDASDGTDMVIGNHHMSTTDPCYHEMQKKRRIEDAQNEQMSNAVSTLAFPATCRETTYFHMGSNASEFTFADAQRLAYEKKQALESMLVFNQVMRERTNRPVQAHSLTSHGAVLDCHRLSTPTVLSSHSRLECSQPSTPEKAPGYSKSLDYEIYGPQARVELLRGSQVKMKTSKRKKKEQVPVNNSISSNCSQMDHVPASRMIASFATQKYYTQKSARVQTTAVQDYQATINHKVSDSSGLQSRQVVSCRNPIDDIIWKLLHLKIDGGHEDATALPQYALVPYAGDGGTIVPFEGPFELIKKKKPRPKVDLDPESNRVWNLLMGKEAGEGEGTEMDREKWWEEERRVFRGRADSFIARMHLIQGDRRFSKWKGSVVDSVVGVFLTQNVSDHLSSSAFMCLAARFPLKGEGNDKTNSAEMIRPIAVHDTNKWPDKISEQEFSYESLSGINEAKQIDNRGMAKIYQSPESSNGGVCIDYCKENSLDSNERELPIDHESPSSASGTTVTAASCTSAVEYEDRPLEDFISLQNSVASSQSSSECDYQNQANRSPLSNLEAEELLSGGLANGFTSFMELLHMESTRSSGGQLELIGPGNGRKSSAECGNMVGCLAHSGMRKSPAVNGPNYLSCSSPSVYNSNSYFYPRQHEFMSLPCTSPSYCRKDSLNTGSGQLEKANVETNQSYHSHLTPPSPEISRTNTIKIMGKQFGLCAGNSTNAMEQNKLLRSSAVPSSFPCASITKNSVQPVTSSGIGVGSVKQSCSRSQASSERNCSSLFIHHQNGNTSMYQEKEMRVETQLERNRSELEDQIQNCRTPQPCSSSHHIIDRNDLDALQADKSNLTNESCTPQKASAAILNSASKVKKVKIEKKPNDWDSLRRQACQTGFKKEHSRDTMDSLDYEAVRCADVNEISHAIRERGMNNMLAERIKDFLNRLVRDHGSIDLEWLRDVPPDKAKDYLLSIRGLGLKSVECVRLLTLHHLAFPVDTNVGRICVRLGWVPLQPLPESLQLHLLEMYPVLETIQKYLWPRLCKLDQRTLYELHYQLITFGKVFCTKSRPNCNACPMRGECKHFASAFASARLALPGPEEKSIVPSDIPITSEAGHAPVFNLLPLPHFEGGTLSHDRTVIRNCEPIIEEPATPEPECIGTSEIDIEDAFYNDPEEIPTIKLNLEEFTQNLQDYMQKNNMSIQDGDMSKALVAIAPEAASIPTPKLKNVSRLRTEHQVYELPDGHPLLEGLDKRERDDPCPYLLAIWTPGETAQSIDPPTAYCNSQETGKLCDKQTCFSCNSVREAQAHMVRGTILIPCRTANRGSFPLNGTYFQVNEVFADHHSSRDPIDVPRDWIWNLPRRTVYFGTSIPSIFKGLTTQGIQHCFWRGFVCVRGFDRTTRAPKPLFARLHIAASKVTRNKKTTTTEATTKEVK